jgi:two-component system chemotaxis response regulator CheB
VTFYSAADAYGAGAIGVVLTGANSDGSRGLRRIFDRGGLAIVQDPTTAESPTMPSAAVRCVPGARVEPIKQIAETLIGLSGAGNAGRAPALRESPSDEGRRVPPRGLA